VTSHREPIFNVPGIILAIIAVCALVLAGQTYLLTDAGAAKTFIYCLGFVPARYEGAALPPALCPRGTGAEIWTFVTYAFLHGNVTHLAVNTIGFLPFGSAVARRFGTMRCLGFFAATAVGAALMHLATHWGGIKPLVGASGAISGFMAGAIRFAFQHGGPLTVIGSGEPAVYNIPAPPLSSALRDSRVLVFSAAWLGLNLFVGLTGGFGIAVDEHDIAWEAHIGGFLAGLLLFPAFDPVRTRAGTG
jgi:membrane associated rhomboid family serine protease